MIEISLNTIVSLNYNLTNGRSYNMTEITFKNNPIHLEGTEVSKEMWL